MADLPPSLRSLGLSLERLTRSSRESLAWQTERRERATLLSSLEIEQTLPPAHMLRILAAGCADAPPRAQPNARAVEHPSLRPMLRRIASLDCKLAIDTSLRAKVPEGVPPPLGKDLHSIGGYFSARRRCIGIAEDTRWHELVHEVIHASFFSVKRSKAADGREPLLTHQRQYQRRGYSEEGAEELVCREHEMYSLRGSLPSVGAAGSMLVLWDNMLVDAQADLQAGRALSMQQKSELRRVRMLRACITSPPARLAHLGCLVFGLSCAVTAIVSYLFPQSRMTDQSEQ